MLHNKKLYPRRFRIKPGTHLRIWKIDRLKPNFFERPGQLAEIQSRKQQLLSRNTYLDLLGLHENYTNLSSKTRVPAKHQTLLLVHCEISFEFDKQLWVNPYKSLCNVWQ